MGFLGVGGDFALVSLSAIHPYQKAVSMFRPFRWFFAVG